MFAVQRRLELCALNGDLQRVPRIHLQWNVLHPLLNETALTFYKRPEHHVVFLAVEAHREIVAVRLQIEQDSGALIELPATSLKRIETLPSWKSSMSLATAYGTL